MQVEVVRSAAGLADIQEEWRSLEAADSRAPYYVTHRFVAAWWDAYAHADNIDLYIVCLRHNGRLVGIAPFSIRLETRKGQQVRVLRFASHGDYMGILVDPAQSADTIVKNVLAFLEEEQAHDAIALTNIPGSSPLAAFLLRSESNSDLVFHVENPYIDLRDYDGFQDYTARSLPAKTRKYRNKLFRECDVRFRVLHGNEENIFDRIADLHRREKRFLVEQKARGERLSLYEDPSRTQHIKNVFTDTDDAVTFIYERQDGELLGYRTCFLQGRTLFSWNSAYNPDFNDFRIGKVIQYDILEHVFGNDMADVFDFGAGRYAWKFEWTDKFTTSYRFQRRSAAAQRQGYATDSDQAEPGRDRKRLVREPSASQQHAIRESMPARARRAAGRAARGMRANHVRRAAGRARAGAVRALQPPVIWYVPHPDDETIFMGGSIRRSRRRNIVVLLSRGGASGALVKVSERLGQPLTRAEFMAGRLREFNAAIQPLGVAGQDVILRDLPDGSIEPTAVRAIIEEMARHHPRASHRTMSYLDPHRDHAAAGTALRDAVRSGVVRDGVFYLPIPLVDERLGRQVPLTAREIEAKKAALREYKRWNPAGGRYAIGSVSVAGLIKRQLRSPMERVHDANYDLSQDHHTE